MNKTFYEELIRIVSMSDEEYLKRITSVYKKTEKPKLNHLKSLKVIK